MRFLIGEKELLLNSTYYQQGKCWDYPLERLDCAIKEVSEDTVFVICEDKRIYETFCEESDIKNLYIDLKQEVKLKEYEEAALSVFIKIYVRFGSEAANQRIGKWENKFKDANIKEIIRRFNVIVSPATDSIENETITKKKEISTNIEDKTLGLGFYEFYELIDKQVESVKEIQNYEIFKDDVDVLKNVNTGTGLSAITAKHWLKEICKLNENELKEYVSNYSKGTLDPFFYEKGKELNGEEIE